MKLFVVLSAAFLTITSLEADSIFSLTAGPTTSFATLGGQKVAATASEQLLVTSAALLNLTYTIDGNPPGRANCVFGGSNSLCVGNADLTASILGNPSAFVQVSGPYQFTPNGGGDNTMVNCAFLPQSSCTFLLQPGLYTYMASVNNELDGLGGATVSPFSEGFTGILSVESGSVELYTVPEPATLSLVFLPVIAAFIIQRQRSVRRNIMR